MIKQFEDTLSWFNERHGKITGTKLKGLSVKPRKPLMIGEQSFNEAELELLVERLTIYEEEVMSPARRGLALEADALAVTNKVTGINFLKADDLLISSDDLNHYASPDGYTEDWSKILETKCFGSKRHLSAFVEFESENWRTGSVWLDIKPQVLNYFLASQPTDTVVLSFYDPRFISNKLALHAHEIKREDFSNELEEMRAAAISFDEKVNAAVIEVLK